MNERYIIEIHKLFSCHAVHNRLLLLYTRRLVHTNTRADFNFLGSYQMDSGFWFCRTTHEASTSLPICEYCRGVGANIGRVLLGAFAVNKEELMSEGIHDQRADTVLSATEKGREKLEAWIQYKAGSEQSLYTGIQKPKKQPVYRYTEPVKFSDWFWYQAAHPRTWVAVVILLIIGELFW